MMKYKRLVLGFGAVLAIFAGSVVVPARVMAAPGSGCNVLDFDNVRCVSNKDNDKLGQENIINTLKGILKLLTIGVGVAAVGGLTYAGILYSSASGDVQQTAKAKSIITNVVVGILAFAVMSIVINFLVPGGIITS